MSKFDEFVDDFVLKAKSAAGVAQKKTGEVVEVGKVRYQIKQTQWDIEKTYAKLGAIVYESRKSSENFEEIISLAVTEIDSLTEQLDELEEKLREFKNVCKCPGCGKENDMTHTFCSRCGTPLEFEEEDEAEPIEAEVIDAEEVSEEPAEDPWNRDETE